jgi:hypothetical protein
MKFTIFSILAVLLFIYSKSIKQKDLTKNDSNEEIAISRDTIPPDTLQYYSIEKWTSTNMNSGDKPSYGYNFYAFNNFLDTLYIGYDAIKPEHNIDEDILYKFLADTFKQKHYDENLELLEIVYESNMITDESDRDNSVTVLDINGAIGHKFSIVSLGAKMAIYAMGSCCTGRMSFLIKQENDSIKIIHELPNGIVRGAYIDKQKNIRKVVMEEIYNYYDNHRLTDCYGKRVFELEISKNIIKYSRIISVRNGEPLDYNDLYLKNPERIVYEYK